MPAARKRRDAQEPRAMFPPFTQGRKISYVAAARNAETVKHIRFAGALSVPLFFICRSFLQREGDGAHQDGGERLLAGAS